MIVVLDDEPLLSDGLVHELLKAWNLILKASVLPNGKKFMGNELEHFS
jgi:hypothetical protein